MEIGTYTDIRFIRTKPVVRRRLVPRQSNKKDTLFVPFYYWFSLNKINGFVSIKSYAGTCN